MVHFLPFCGWRFDLSQIGALSEVLVPPAEQINESLQRELYRRHPCNAVRLVANREEPGDASPLDRTHRADEFFRLWKREGVLQPEHDSAYYVVETVFQFEGLEISHWSVIGLLRLPDSAAVDNAGSDVSDVEAIQERLSLLRTCRVGFAPVVALLEQGPAASPDSRSLPDLLEPLVRLIPPVESIDAEGIRRRLWPLGQREARNEILNHVADRSVRWISGTREYVAAMQYRDELLAAGRLTDPNDAARFVMAWLISVDDPGLMIVGPVTGEPDFLSPSGRGEFPGASGLSVHPPIPSGLVFAAIDRS